MASPDSVIDVEHEALATTHHSHELQFQDIPHSQGQGSISGPSEAYEQSQIKEQMHTFTDFPNAGDSDEEKSTSLLEGTKKEPSFWTFEYYQQFFDVDTKQVLDRILGSMFPNPRANYLQTAIRPNPDFYGPFWVCATLVFTTAIAGNLVEYFKLQGEITSQINFHKVTYAAAAVFTYWWLMPTALYGFLYWRGNQAGLTFLEISCVYGYSLAVYIPISILWVVPVDVFRGITVALGVSVSGAVLLLTFWPALREDSKKTAIIILTVMFLCHAALAVGFALYFFHVPQAGASYGTTSAPTTTVASAIKHVTMVDHAAQGTMQSSVINPSHGASHLN